MFQFILFLILFQPIIAAAKGHWSYDNTKAWTFDHHYCGGNMQSPIDLQFNLSRHGHHLRQLRLQELYSREPLELVNNGHTAQLNLKNHYMLKNVAPHNEDYKVEQIHFHWGHSHDQTNGSEHLLDGRAFPLEMHMVTYSSLFPTIGEAMMNTRALAVVGAFFEVSSEPNPALEPIVKALEHIQHKGKTVSLSGDFDLKALIDETRLHRYYRYDGSLTTPPCYESVIWSVLVDPLQVSDKQLRAFQNLKGEKSDVMKNTYRTVQNMGSRILFRSFYSTNIYEDEVHRRVDLSKNHGQYYSANMKFSFILIGLLMFIL